GGSGDLLRLSGQRRTRLRHHRNAGLSQAGRGARRPDGYRGQPALAAAVLPRMKALADCHVLVTPTSYGRHDERLRVELESCVGRVTYNTTGKPLSSAQLAALLPGVDGFIAGLDVVDAAALAAAESPRGLARSGAGVADVDLHAAAARGHVVTTTPRANAA